MASTVSSMVVQLDEVCGTINRQQVQPPRNTGNRQKSQNNKRYADRQYTGSYADCRKNIQQEQHRNRNDRDRPYEANPGYPPNRNSTSRNQDEDRQGPPNRYTTFRNQDEHRQGPPNRTRNFRNRDDERQEPPKQQYSNVDPTFNQGPLCYRCRQRGHFQ